MERMKIVSAKEGTVPVLINLRYHYNLRRGLRVRYRRVHQLTRGRRLRMRSSWWTEKWEWGIVQSTEPILFIDKM